MTKFASRLTRWAPVMVLAAALLPAAPALAQTAPVFTRTLPYNFFGTDSSGQITHALTGNVTIETQRVVDPVAGDVLILSMVFTDFPVYNKITYEQYTVNVRETVMKPFAATVPVEITLPMVWKSGGTDTRSRTAVASWDIFTNPDGSMMTWWTNLVRVND